MKKIGIFLIILMLFAVLFAGQATVTTSSKGYGGMTSYNFVFTDGGTDTATIVPSGKSYFNTDEMENKFISYYMASGETTLDSIRWNLIRQIKSTPSESTWRTAQTITLDSSRTFVGVFNLDTYGRYPIERYLLVGNAAKNAEQSVTLLLSFSKN